MKKREMTQDDLDQLFQNILAQPPIINEEQVNSLLYSSPKAPSGSPARHFIKNHLNILIMSTIVSSIIIGALLWTNAPKHKASQKEDVINPAKSQTTNTITASPKSHSSNTIATLPQSKDSKAKPQNLTVNPKIEDSTQSSIQNAPIMDNPAVIEADSTSKENIISINAAIINSSEHHWPADTVLEGKSMFVNLTDEELSKLGFKVTKDAILYCNKSADGHVCSLFLSITPNYRAKISDTTYFSFRYYFTSSSNFDENSSIDIKEFSMMDTLIPIILVDKARSSKKSMYWFSTNDELFNALPERYKDLGIKYKELKLLKNTNPNKTYVNYFNLEENLKRLRNVNFIELTDKELENLGYEIINDTVPYKESDYEEIFLKKQNNQNAPPEFLNTFKTFDDKDTVYRKLLRLKTNENEKPYAIVFSCKIKGSMHTGGELHMLANNPKTKNPYPKVITDTLGRFKNNYDQLKISNFNSLIPIKLNASKYGFQPTKNGKSLNEAYSRFSRQRVYIFWYEPDSAFISRLPKSIASVLKPEYDAIVKSGGTSSQSCTYFEVCQSTLTLNRLDVYPNPASQKVTIDFNAPEDLTGSITLVDIKGSEVKVLQPTTRFAKGENKFSADVSGISPGIYLIYINTNKGFRTQRIIVTR